MASEVVKWIEKIVIQSLMVMMTAVIILATFELGWLLVKDAITAPMFLLEIDELLEIFGMFMLVLIGVELLETIQTYYVERVIRVEIVVAVAIIAIARKVIIMDYKQLTTLTLWDVGGVVLALALAYYLLRQSHSKSDGLKFGKENQTLNHPRPD